MILRQRAVSLGKLFEHTHDLDVAVYALAAAESDVKTAEACKKVKEVAYSSNTLARILGRQSEQTGNAENLDWAISVLIPEHSTNNVVGLGYLATLLGICFEQQGAVHDLNASISYTKSVLRLMSNDGL